MTHWTPEAEQRLDSYLAEVFELARSQGEAGEDFLGDLRTHIRSDAEAIAGGVVTLQHLVRALANSGTPHDVVGLDAAGPAAARAVPPPIPPAGAHFAPEPAGPPTVVVQKAPAFSGTRNCLIIGLICLVAIPFVLAIFGTLAAVLLPALSRSREAARRASCQNNLKQLGLELYTYADRHGGRLPPLSGAGNHFVFDGAFQAGINPDLLQCPSDGETSNLDYIYLGYAVRDQEELEALLNAYNDAGGEGDAPMSQDAISIPGGTLELLQMGRPESARIPVLVEWGDHHHPRGGNVLYLDGHVEFIKFGSRFPMTDEFFAAVKSLGE
ncbi:MAG: DUF1559 domain-containing protein [Candidatus Hydrogenedentes bacterium]|nr:DUF1559 domain-containing protein [Candidatus Hydrogenedentota bacterium]